MRMHKRISYAVAALVATMFLVAQVGVHAQDPCGVIGCATPTPAPGTPTPNPGSPSPGPATPTPSATTDPAATVLPELPGGPTAKPKKTAKPSPTPKSTPGFDGIDGKLPDDLQKGFDLQVPDIPRTLPNNTTKLVQLLQPLTELGLPLEQVLVDGMGRFPVAGLAYWSDDWLAPRSTPVPHLHHGLDLFADFGTPLRAVDDGTVSFQDDPDGWGIAVFLKTANGTEFVYAHLQARAEDIKSGDRVKTGTVIGYVGNTGNALGGAPHCHFEVHRPDAVPPKPYVDRWLRNAIKFAPNYVAMRRHQILGIKGGLKTARSSAPAPALPKGSLDATMVLTVLDPVGGSVGLLPKLQLERAKRPAISDALLQQIIKNRLRGYLFAPPAAGFHQAD